MPGLVVGAEPLDDVLDAFGNRAAVGGRMVNVEFPFESGSKGLVVVSGDRVTDEEEASELGVILDIGVLQHAEEDLAGVEDVAFDVTMNEGLLDERFDVFLTEETSETVLSVVSLGANLDHFVDDLNIHESSVFLEKFSGDPGFFFCGEMVGDRAGVELAVEDGFEVSFEVFFDGIGVLKGSFDVELPG